VDYICRGSTTKVWCGGFILGTQLLVILLLKEEIIRPRVLDAGTVIHHWKPQELEWRRVHNNMHFWKPSSPFETLKLWHHGISLTVPQMVSKTVKCVLFLSLLLLGLHCISWNWSNRWPQREVILSMICHLKIGGLSRIRVDLGKIHPHPLLGMFKYYCWI